MKCAAGWVLAVTLWLVVGWVIFVGVSDVAAPASCDPTTAWDKCTTVSGPGPGNGR